MPKPSDTRPAPAGDLAGTVRQVLGDLSVISEELDSGGPARPSFGSRLDRLAGELREAAEMVRAIPAKARP